jgi:hypothetical protein
VNTPDINALKESYFAGRLSWGDLVVMTQMPSYELHPLIYPPAKPAAENSEVQP